MGRRLRFVRRLSSLRDGCGGGCMAPSSQYAYFCTSKASKVSTTHTCGDRYTRRDPLARTHTCRTCTRWETVSAAPPARRLPTKCRFRAQTLSARLRAAASEASQSCRMRLRPTPLQGPLPRSAGAVAHTPRATSSAGTQLLRCQYLYYCTSKATKLRTGSNTWRWHVAAVTSAESL